LVAATYRLVPPADIAFVDGRELDMRAWALGLGGALLVRRAVSGPSAILSVDGTGVLAAPAVVDACRIPAGTAVLCLDTVTLRDRAGTTYRLVRLRPGTEGPARIGFRGPLPEAGAPLLVQPAAMTGSVLCDGDAHDGALAAGTSVLTLDGAIAVEHLVPGDRIITRDRGAQPLRWVERVDRLPAVGRPTLVRLGRGALGPGRPERDMTVTGRTHVLLRGTDSGRPTRALVPAARLADGHEVTAASPGAHLPPLFRLWLERREIVYADGLEVETARPLPQEGLPTAAPVQGPRAVRLAGRRGRPTG